jgi:hypothetical protein
VYTALAPASRWTLIGSDGTAAARSSSLGWAATYRVATSTTATLRFGGGPVTPLALLYSVLAWLAALAFVSVRRLGGGWTRLRTGRRRTRVHRDDTGDSPAPDGAALTVGAGEVR